MTTNSYQEDAIAAYISRVEELTKQAELGGHEWLEVAEKLGPKLRIYTGADGLMRGIAKAVLPDNYQFEVVITLDGQKKLLITGIL
jgi:hypothetical protein